MSWLRAAAVAAAMAAGVLLFYRSALSQYFWFDDFIFLQRARLEAPGDWLRAFSLEMSQRGWSGGAHFDSHSYRPLSTNLYFGAVQGIFGLAPRAFHVLGALCLALNGALVVLLLGRLGVATGLAMGLGLVYALCEINFGTQLWISVVQELSFTAFALGAVIVHVGEHPPGGRARAGAALLLLLALLCKEMAVAVPAVVLAHEIAVRRSRPARALAGTAALWIVALGYLAWRLLVLPLPESGPYAVRVGGFVFESLLRYGEWSASALLLTRRTTLLCVAGVALAAQLWRAAPRARRVALFGAAWLPLALLPVLFLPNHVYEHYLVFPVIGWVVLAGALLGDALARLRSRALAGALVALATGAFAWGSQARFEERSATRARHTARIERVHRELRELHPELAPGTTLYLESRGERLRHFGKNLRKGIQLVYRDPTLRVTRLPAILPLDIGPGAALAFSVAADGALSEHRDRCEVRIARLEAVPPERRAYPSVRAELAEIHLRRGSPARARAALRPLAGARLDRAEALRVARLVARAGDLATAEAALETVLRGAPEAERLAELGLLYAELDGERSAALLRRALESDPRHVGALHALARARLETDPTAAARSLERALALRPGDSGLHRDLGRTLLRRAESLLTAGSRGEAEALLDRAAAALERAAELAGAGPALDEDRGDLERLRGNRERALESYGRALLAQPCPATTPSAVALKLARVQAQAPPAPESAEGP